METESNKDLKSNNNTAPQIIEIQRQRDFYK